MSKIDKQYRLPNGKYTSSGIKMSKEWRKIYSPICKEFGLSVIGYYPGISFRYNDGTYCFQLDSNMATRLSYLIKENKKLKKAMRSLYEK